MTPTPSGPRAEGVVTVVMPAYNVEHFVTTSVRSVLEQSYPALEFIVVDDGSTDSTAARLGEVADARLRVIHQANGGSSAARNAGIARGTGEFIAFIDGDDVWLPEKLGKHVAALREHPGVDLTFAWSRIVDERGNDTGRTSVPVSGTVSFERLMAMNVVGNGSAVVLRREALDRAGYFDEELFAAVEHDVWLRVALLRQGNVMAIPEVLSLYRMRAGQITKDWRRMETAWRQLVEKIRRLAPGRVATVEGEARARMYRYVAYIAYETGEFSQAARHLVKAVSGSPLVILRDRGTWVLTAGLAVRVLLRRGAHRWVDAFARRVRGARAVPATQPARHPPGDDAA